MTKLSVNVNKVALLRNSRPLAYPSPLRLSRIALEAGAAGITVHPRPDQRHIRYSDVDDLAGLLSEPLWTDPGTAREFNIEGNPLEGAWMDVVRRVRPTQATLVPDDPNQSTSDHGWDVAAHAGVLRPIVAELQGLGCRVSLFVDAEVDVMPAAKAVGADRVELYTEPYASAWAAGGATREAALKRYADAAVAAQAAGLMVNAGHDLTLENLTPFLKAVPGVAEVSIGHALIADALELGVAGAVEAYLAAIAAAA